MEYNERYFKHVDNCECNIEKITETMEAAISRHARMKSIKMATSFFMLTLLGTEGQSLEKLTTATRQCQKLGKMPIKSPKDAPAFTLVVVLTY